jgi:Tail tubular protein
VPQITNLVPTTEIEAVNAMMSVLGEQPIGTDDAALDAAVEAGSPVDVILAVNILRAQAREVQTLGWKFNTENGYQLSPDGTLEWVDTLGVTTLLNVFVQPANMVAWEPTKRYDQMQMGGGMRGPQLTGGPSGVRPAMQMDFTVRRAQFYQNAESAFPFVFYDRALNREGWDSTIVSYIYVNPTWLFNFEDIPEEARRFIYVRAARQFQQQAVGSSELAAFSQEDEAFALRQLKRAHGQNDNYNILENISVYASFGRRPYRTAGFRDGRGSPGKAP